MSARFFVGILSLLSTTLSFELGAESSTLLHNACPATPNSEIIVPPDYAEKISKGQIEVPGLIPPDPRVSASAPVLSGRQVVLADMYHNGLLYNALVKREQIKGCRLNFKVIPPTWLPVFGPIFHVEAVFEFDSARPLALRKQKMARDPNGMALVEEDSSATTDRIVISPEPEVFATDTMKSIGLLPGRYPMIYRAVSREQFVRENFQTPEDTRKSSFSREISHATQAKEDMCWRYFVQMLYEANATRVEQQQRAKGSRVSRYPYTTLGTNCVSLTVGNLVASQGIQPTKLPSLPGTAMHKQDWLEGGVILEPKVPTSPLDWGVSFRPLPTNKGHTP